MTEPLTPAPGQPGGYPTTLTFALPDRIARWRPLVHWILLVPQYFVLWALSIAAGVLVFVAWVMGVLLGRVPLGILEFIALYQRYNYRVTAYQYFLTDTYPPFAFDTTLADPGDYPGVRVDFARQEEGRNRLTIFFRILLAIPHFIVLGLVSIAVAIVGFVAFFAVIVLGRWPAGMRSFVEGYLRWSNRFSAYLNVLVDDYPPFSLS